ncbi:MAG: hypothetical protein JWR72_3996 [Flavisolibacter sp.]|jgi:hypothetical protein|nr:hypothetical protein [Flavisolibacter sp.]
MIYSHLSKKFSINTVVLSLASLFFTACNNDASTTAAGNDTAVKNTTSATAQSWTQEDELEFMSGCVDNAKGRFGEEKAYTYCKCILAQVKTKYAMDSTLISKLSDTAQVAKMAQNCE